MRPLLALSLVTLLAACIEATPPKGQFFCNDASDCPDNWLCAPDDRCYEEELPCYVYAQETCPGGGCYTTTNSSEYGGSTRCFLAGTLGHGETGCTREGMACEAGTGCFIWGDVGICRQWCRGGVRPIECPGIDRCSNFLVNNDVLDIAGDMYICTVPGE